MGTPGWCRPNCWVWVMSLDGNILFKFWPKSWQVWWKCTRLIGTIDVSSRCEFVTGVLLFEKSEFFICNVCVSIYSIKVYYSNIQVRHVEKLDMEKNLLPCQRLLMKKDKTVCNRLDQCSKFESVLPFIVNKKWLYWVILGVFKQPSKYLPGLLIKLWRLHGWVLMIL